MSERTCGFDSHLAHKLRRTKCTDGTQQSTKCGRISLLLILTHSFWLNEALYSYIMVVLKSNAPLRNLVKRLDSKSSVSRFDSEAGYQIKDTI